MSVDKDGFGPGLPYLLESSENLPAGVRWVQVPCPTCGHRDLIEIIRTKDGKHIMGLRWIPQPVENLPPDAMADLARQRCLRKTDFTRLWPPD